MQESFFLEPAYTRFGLNNKFDQSTICWAKSFRMKVVLYTLSESNVSQAQNINRITHDDGSNMTRVKYNPGSNMTRVIHDTGSNMTSNQLSKKKQLPSLLFEHNARI